MNTLRLDLNYDQAVAIAAELIRDCIKTHAWLRERDMLDDDDHSEVMLEQCLDYLIGDGLLARLANDPDAYSKGYEAGALAGDASEVGLVGYQLGRREERERCAWILERMLNENSEPSWHLACLAAVERIRGA